MAEGQLHPKCLREKEIDRIIEELDTNKDKRVSFTMFWSVVVIFCSIVGGIFTNIYSQIDELESGEDVFHKDVEGQINANKLDQTKIEVQLTQIQKDIASINVALKELAK